MPQQRKYTDNAQRQAAYRHRTQQARQQQLSAKGLPPLPTIPTIPGYPRWRRSSEEIQRRLEVIRDEMQDYYDERSDDWRQSENAQRMEEQLRALGEIIDNIEGLLD